MLIGLAGIVLPALPGVILIFAGLALAAWAEGFQYVGAGTLTILGVLSLLAWSLDWLAGSLGARHFGASRHAIVGAMLGALVGIFFGPLGILVGPFLGAVIGELLARRDLGQAGRAGVGAWLGLLLGVVAKLAISITMIGLYLSVRIWRAS